MAFKAHLVGSVGLDSVDAVFTTAGKLLRGHLRRIPDGEPGGRRVWTSWQYPVFLANPWLEPDPDAPVPARGAGLRRMRLVPGVKPVELRFGELGYAREARASYEDFRRARERGILPQDIRFQVSIPTPINVLLTTCTPEAVKDIEPAYEQAMLTEVKHLRDAIPHEDLCVQWDMVREVMWFDGRASGYDKPTAASREFAIERIARLAQAVPNAAELGFHLCYGDWGGRHAIEPLDTRAMVELMNAIAAAVERTVTYFHLPVPIDRSDDGYFAPLRELKLSPSTEIYLGLVHVKDGVEGTRRRMSVAAKYIESFGISTECGLGRAKTPETVEKILEVCAKAAA
jgi:methionine synthase II (cobalamin-independent)